MQTKIMENFVQTCKLFFKTIETLKNYFCCSVVSSSLRLHHRTDEPHNWRELYAKEIKLEDEPTKEICVGEWKIRQQVEIERDKYGFA